MFVFIGKMIEKGVSHSNTHTHTSVTSHVTPFLSILFFTGLLVVTAPLFRIVIVIVAAGV
jgi:hypothetical protein